MDAAKPITVTGALRHRRHERTATASHFIHFDALAGERQGHQEYRRLFM
jgi:hypothetical protein